MLNKLKNSFTLIELLVVIAIIGLLASIVLVWLGGARAQTRDTKRKAEVGTLSKALEIYYADNDKYPLATDWTKLEEDASNTGPFSQAIKPYLPQIPKDPLYPKVEGEKVFSYQYKSTGDGQGYKLHVEMETGEHASYETYSSGGVGIEYSGGGGEGCFLAGTQVTMADNTCKSIENIKPGDMVKSYNEKTNEVKLGEVAELLIHSSEEMGDYYLTINHQLKVTPGQSLLINGEWQKADNLKKGDSFMASLGYYSKALSVEKIFQQQPTYNLKVEPYHNFFVNCK